MCVLTHLENCNIVFLKESAASTVKVRHAISFVSLSYYKYTLLEIETVIKKNTIFFLLMTLLIYDT